MTTTVIVVGSVNVDLVIHTTKLPRPGETVIGGTFSQSPGGKGGNQAAAAAKLGATAWLVGVVGPDAFGDAARGDLGDAGVDVSEVRRGERHTGVAGIAVDEHGENLIAVASGANEELTAKMVEESLSRIARRGAVVLTNLEVPDEAVVAAARAAEQLGCSFVLNPAPARPVSDELLRACDVVTPNEHEAQSLGSGSAWSIVERGASIVVITRGAEGADVLRRGAGVHHQPAFEVDAVDTTGAGDAFSATLAWALADGHAIEAAVERAAAAGALATRAAGARGSLADSEEVEDIVARGTASVPDVP